MKILGVISYFEHRDYIEQAIKSLGMEQNLPVEVLILNDDPDMNFDWIQSTYPFHIIDDGKNRGQAYRFNQSIEYANEHGYEWIMFQGADDYSLPFRSLVLNKLALQVPEMDMIYTDFISVFSDHSYVYQTSRPFDPISLIEGNYICASSVCIRAKAAEKAKFDIHLAYGEDWLWYHNLLRKNVTIAYLPIPTVYYRETTSVIKEKTEDKRNDIRHLIMELYDEKSLNNWRQRFRGVTTDETLN